MDIFSIFFNLKVYCVFSLESPRFEWPHRGDSNVYTQYTIFNIKKKITLNYPNSAAMGFFSRGLKNEFKTAMVNKPSVFESLKIYCIDTALSDRHYDYKLALVAPFKVDGSALMGNSSAIFIFVPLYDLGQLLQERLCFCRNKFLPFKSTSLC